MNLSLHLLYVLYECLSFTSVNLTQDNPLIYGLNMSPLYEGLDNVTAVPYTTNVVLKVTDMDVMANRIEDFTAMPPMNSTTRPYDANGAMKFTIAVVMVYGVAVIGVFVMGYYGRRRPEHDEMDRQASVFIKNLANVRHQIEKRSQLGTVTKLLNNIHNSSGDVNSENNMSSLCKVDHLGKDLFSYMTIPLITVSKQEKSSSEYNDSAFKSGSSNCKSTIDGGLHILEEVNETDADEFDDVFMTDEERQKFGVDLYVNLHESDIL